MGTAAGTTTTTLSSVRSIINASSGTAGTLTGQGVGVALIDTGVSPVPGLPAAQIVNGPDLSFESQAGQLRYLDTYGHGTHMAGIIVGNDTATGTKGLAPKAKLTSIKVGTVQRRRRRHAGHRRDRLGGAAPQRRPGQPDPGDQPVVRHRRQLGVRTDPVQYAVEQAWKAGIVVVVAAGNNGNSTAKLTNPATDPYVISVGAAGTKGTTSTTDDTLSTFTNLATDYRGLDIVAPGESIVSLRDQGSNIDESYPPPGSARPCSRAAAPRRLRRWSRRRSRCCCRTGRR